MPWLAQDAVFKRLASIAEVAAMSKEERSKYDESLRIYRDTISVMEGQYQEGMAEGKAETARKLKAMNLMTTEQIAEATGLSVEEIEAL